MTKSILVIDDEKAVRNSFLLTFENSYFKIDTVESGIEGIEKIKNHTYDLIFLDLKMPGMDGIETLRRIRSFNTKVPIYIFTAFHHDFFQKLELATREGLSFEIIQKPLDSNQLMDLTQSILSD